MRPTLPILVFLAAAAFHTVALACSCRPLANAAEHAAHADTIFRGRVLTSTPNPASPEIFAITTFEVTAPIKMMPHWTPTSTIEVRHASTRNGPQCSIWYEAGQEVLVVARAGRDGYLHTSSCDAPRWPEADYRAALSLN
jgi:hypothetical protein